MKKTFINRATLVKSDTGKDVKLYSCLNERVCAVTMHRKISGAPSGMWTRPPGSRNGGIVIRTAIPRTYSEWAPVLMSESVEL
jgi:hypothetical protein